MTARRQLLVFLSLVTLGTALTTARQPTRPQPGAEWPYYASDAAATHYSALDPDYPRERIRPIDRTGRQVLVVATGRADQTALLAFGLQ